MKMLLVASILCTTISATGMAPKGKQDCIIIGAGVSGAIPTFSRFYAAHDVVQITNGFENGEYSTAYEPIATHQVRICSTTFCMIKALIENNKQDLLAKINKASASLSWESNFRQSVHFNSSYIEISSYVGIDADLEKEIKDYLGENIFSKQEKLP